VERNIDGLMAEIDTDKDSRVNWIEFKVCFVLFKLKNYMDKIISRPEDFNRLFEDLKHM